MDEKALKQLLAGIGKSLDVSIGQVKDLKGFDVESIPTGSFTLDFALGVGGFPRGRVIEIYGKESGGKTLISLLAIAEAQRRGGLAAFIDAEHSFDKKWAAKHGVDVPHLVLVNPDSGEQALMTLQQLVESGGFDIIVVDSVAALIPQAEVEAEMTEQQMGLQARMMSKAMRMLVGPIAKSRTVVIFINQLRETMAMYGEKEVTPGGKALKYYSSVRLAVKKLNGSEIKEGSKILGHTVNIAVKKNKVGPPCQEAEFVLRFDIGVDRVDELATLAINSAVIKQNGPMYVYKDKSWKGRDAVVEALRDEKLQTALWADVRSVGTL